MEHVLIHIIVETIQALDRKLQRPVHRVIPDYASFKADPHAYLAQATVVFGPRRRHVLATVIGAVAATAVVLLLYFAFTHMPKPKQPDWSRMIGIAVTFVVVTLVGRALALRLLPGGTMTLTAKGVAMTYGENLLFVPWDVLQATGNVFEPDHKIVVLPINPSIPVALTGPDEEVTAVLPYDLELPQAEASDYNQLALKDLYEVRIGEVGALLRDLGLRLGTSDRSLQTTLSTMVAPLAVVEENGWLKIQLTQLPFPPICAGCGESTNDNLQLPLAAPANRRFTLPVPFCRECAKVRWRHRLIWAGIGLAIGAAIGLTLAAWINGAGRDVFFLFMAGTMGIMIAVPMAMLLQTIPNFRYTPVRCIDYKPDKGTVKLRFRDPEKARNLLAALGISPGDLAEKPKSKKSVPDPLAEEESVA
jgi:hypothetical protein